MLQNNSFYEANNCVKPIDFNFRFIELDDKFMDRKTKTSI